MKIVRFSNIVLDPNSTTIPKHMYNCAQNQDKNSSAELKEGGRGGL
jgi:hypothetical protein